ncbi:MAG: thermonuclease family protein [Robiginitomaculum sp.]
MKAWSKRAIAFAGAMLLGAGAGGAMRAPLELGESGRVERVVDGDTLYLEGGLKVRLAAMDAPEMPPSRARRTGAMDGPYAEQSKAALIAITDNRRVGLYYGGARRDRYKRALAQVYTLDAAGNKDVWAQQEMVKLGMARVYTWPDTYQDTAKLYAAEREARAAGRGIWADDYYAIRGPSPDDLAQDVDSFQLVEGIITSAANVRGMTYLNFGASYKTDFTITVNKKSKKRFDAAGIDLLALEGARVRVRGWIELHNGPAIWLDHPERLEVLD